jgi:uncharacterized membrane protein
LKPVEESITVNAPIEKVFEYVSDFTRHGEWSGHGLEVSGTGGPVAVGATFSTVAKQFGTQREQSTVTEVRQNAAFAWESKGALGVVRHWFGVTGQDGSTVLAKGLEVVQPTFLAKVMGWRISLATPKLLRQDLEKIKAAVEGSG